MTKSSAFSNRVGRLMIGALAAVSVVAVVAAVTINSDARIGLAECPGCVGVSAPTIGLNVTAKPGDQSVIDEQLGVALYTALTTGLPGGPGTVWIAGHRTSHGGVFNRVPSLQVGEAISLTDDAGTHQYIVSRVIVVSASTWTNDVNIHDMSRSVLILQTSHPDKSLRYLVEAFGALP